MQVSVEEINGLFCTVIRRPFNAEWVKGRIDTVVGFFVEYMEYSSYLEEWRFRSVTCCNTFQIDHISKYMSDQKYKDVVIKTILPPLRKHPEPEDMKSLYGHMAEGLTPVLKCCVGVNEFAHFPINTEDGQYCLNDSMEFRECHGYIDTITHAIDEQGNRVEIAIEG